DRLESGLERKAIDGAFNRRHAPRGELRTGVLWQDEKGPGGALLALRRLQELRFETDLGSGFGHLPGTVKAKRADRGSDPPAARLYVTPRAYKSGSGGGFTPRQQRDRRGLALPPELSRPCL